MTEYFFHFIWKHQYFNKQALRLLSGEEINILHPGYHNQDAGPDFINAKIKIGEVTWTGAIEIHINGDDWYKHQHHLNRAYNNVILHVLWNDTKEVFRREDGTTIPSLSLNGRIKLSLFNKYNVLSGSLSPVPCAPYIKEVESVNIASMQSRMMYERLHSKANIILSLAEKTRNDWEETTYRWLLANFGFKKNNESFSLLAQQLPVKFLKKHADHPKQVEALLFGMAGFTDGQDEREALQLQREFEFLSKKYDLDRGGINRSQWKFFRMRPANFPTVRLAQFCALITHYPNLFSFLIALEAPKGLRKAINDHIDPYWLNHYDFGKPSSKLNTIGNDSVTNLIINTVAPLRAAYGIYMDDEHIIQSAINLLEMLPAESNNIISNWREYGVQMQNASDTQAMLQLHNQYCVEKKCLECQIGTSWLQK